MDLATSTPTSHFTKTVCLCDWWLTKSDVEYQGKRIAIGGSVFKESVTSTGSRSREPGRVFSSAPIVTRHDRFTLETADGITVRLRGFINKLITEEKGFSSEVFDYFLIGFPPDWEECAENCLEKESAVKDLSPAVNMGNLIATLKQAWSSYGVPRLGVRYDGHVSVLQDEDHGMPSPAASPGCNNIPNVNGNGVETPLLWQSGKDACNLNGERVAVMDSQAQDVASHGNNSRLKIVKNGNKSIHDVSYHAGLADARTSFDDTTQSKGSAEVCISDASQAVVNLITNICGHKSKKLKARKNDGNLVSLSSMKYDDNASHILTDVTEENTDFSVEIAQRYTPCSSKKVNLPQKEVINTAAETVLYRSTRFSSRKSNPKKKDACNLSDEGAVVMESQTRDIASYGEKSGLESIMEGNESILDVSYCVRLANSKTSCDDTAQSKDFAVVSVPDASQASETLTTTDIGGHGSKKLKTRSSNGNPNSLSYMMYNDNVSHVPPDSDKILHKCGSETTDVPERNTDSSAEAFRRFTRSSSRKVNLSQKDGSNIVSETVLCHSTHCSSRKSKARKKENCIFTAKRDRENNAKGLETSKKINRKLDFGSPMTPAQEHKKKTTRAASEGLSFKRSRSGRLLLPQLEFWRNQIPAYDADHGISGIVDGTDLIMVPAGSRSKPRKGQKMLS